MPQPTALITGANKGIGLAIARQLGERGFSVWIGSRDEARGESAAAGLREAGIEARALTLDVTSDGSVRAAADRLAGAVDALDGAEGPSARKRTVATCMQCHGQTEATSKPAKSQC